MQFLEYLLKSRDEFHQYFPEVDMKMDELFLLQKMFMVFQRICRENYESWNIIWQLKIYTSGLPWKNLGLVSLVLTQICHYIHLDVFCHLHQLTCERIDFPVFYTLSQNSQIVLQLTVILVAHYQVLLLTLKSLWVERKSKEKN